jgi:hypothetical protein
MSSSLRARIALVALFGVFLIPLWTSSLRGLTHLLTCDETTDTDFSVVVGPDGSASVLSSLQVEREVPARELCGGLVVDVGVRSGANSSSPDLVITITNRSEFGWLGSVQVDLDDVSFPIAVGDVAPGERATERVELDLDTGRTYEISGSLLVGP